MYLSICMQQYLSLMQMGHLSSRDSPSMVLNIYVCAYFFSILLITVSLSSFLVQKNQS